MTITEFLEARVAEDEKNAGTYVEVLPEGDMAPLFRRVLAECAAKRAIIGLHGADPANDKPVCLSCGDWWDGSPEPFPCPTLKALAAVYSSHEDYDSGWAL